MKSLLAEEEKPKRRIGFGVQRTLGLEDQIERGQTPPPAAGDVLLRTHDMSNK